MAKGKNNLNKSNSSGWLDNYSEESAINEYQKGGEVKGKKSTLTKLKKALSLRENLGNLNTEEGYNTPLNQILRTAVGMEGKDLSNESMSPIAREQDAFRMYLGLPSRTGAFEQTGANKYRIRDYNKLYPDTLLSDESVRDWGTPHEDGVPDPVNKAFDLYPYDDFVMGKHYITKGKDAKGEYLRYYDKFDLDPTRRANQYIDRNINPRVGKYLKKATPILDELETLMFNPFELEDKVYYDPKTKLRSDIILQQNNQRVVPGQPVAIPDFAGGGKVNAPIYVDNPNDPRLRKYQDSLALFNASNMDRVNNLLKQGFKYDTEGSVKNNRKLTSSQKKQYQKTMGVNPNKFLQNIIQGGNDGIKDNRVGGKKDLTKQVELMHGQITPIEMADLFDNLWRNTEYLQGDLKNPTPGYDKSDKTYRKNPNYGKPLAKDKAGKVIRNFFSVPIYKNPVQPIIYKKTPPPQNTDFTTPNKEESLVLENYVQPIIEKNIPTQEIPVKQDFTQYIQPKGYSRQGTARERQSESFYDANGKMTGQIIEGQYVPTEYGKFLQSGMTEDEYLNQFAGGGRVNDNKGYLISNLNNFTPKKIINSNYITTNNMAFPIEANGVVLYPNTGDYIFPTDKVTEIPIMQGGGRTNLPKSIPNDPLLSPGQYQQLKTILGNDKRALEYIDENLTPSATIKKGKERKAKELSEKAQKLSEKEKRIALSAKRQEVPFLSKDRWTPESIAQETGAIGDKFSLQNLPFIGENIPDFLDVTGGIGSMASGLGKIPLNVQEGNYGQIALDLAVPLTTGALAGIGTQNTGQFANNLVNPLAGAGDLISSIDKNINNLGFKNYSNIPNKLNNTLSNLDYELRTVVQKLNPFYQKKAKQELINANKWQDDWYNDPKTIERINTLSDYADNDKIYKDGLPNNWDRILDRVNNKNYLAEFQTRDSKLQNILKGKERLHKGNYGVSGYNLDNTFKGNRQNFVDKYSPKVELTAVHEGNHGLTDGNNLLSLNDQEKIVKIFGDDAKIPRRNSARQFDSYNEYLQDPTEVYARIMEIRNHMGLKPGEILENDKFFNIMDRGRAGEMPVESRFFNLIKNPPEFKNLFNRLPTAALPIGLAGAASQTRDYQNGGKIYNDIPQWAYNIEAAETARNGFPHWWFSTQKLTPERKQKHYNAIINNMIDDGYSLEDTSDVLNNIIGYGEDERDIVKYAPVFGFDKGDVEELQKNYNPNVFKQGGTINNDMKKKLKKYQAGGYLSYQDAYKGFGVGPNLTQDNSYYRSIMPSKVENIEAEINQPSALAGLNNVLGGIDQIASQGIGLMGNFMQSKMSGAMGGMGDVSYVPMEQSVANNLTQDPKGGTGLMGGAPTLQTAPSSTDNFKWNWSGGSGITGALPSQADISAQLPNDWKGVPFLRNGGYLRKYQDGGMMDMPVGYPEYIHKSNVFQPHEIPVPRVHFSDDTSVFDMGVNLNDLVQMNGGGIGKYQNGGNMSLQGYFNYLQNQNQNRVPSNAFNSNSQRANAAQLAAATENDFMNTKLRNDRQQFADNKVDWGFMNWAKEPAGAGLGLLSSVPVLGDTVKGVVGDSFLTRTSGYQVGKGAGNVGLGTAKLVAGIPKGDVSMILGGVGDIGEGVGSTVGNLNAKSAMGDYNKQGYVSGKRLANAAVDFNTTMGLSSKLYGMGKSIVDLGNDPSGKNFQTFLNNKNPYNRANKGQNDLNFLLGKFMPDLAGGGDDGGEMAMGGYLNNYQEGGMVLMPEYLEIPKYKKGGLTPTKARQMLHDKSYSTDKQRKYFGYISSQKKASGGWIDTL